MGMSYLIDTHIFLWWLFEIMAQAELENLPIITYDSAFQTGLIQVISN